MMAAPPDARPLTCPVCQRFLCNTDGSYVDCPPCKNCGAQTVVRVDKLRSRTIQTPAGPLEVKNRSGEAMSGPLEVRRT